MLEGLEDRALVAGGPVKDDRVVGNTENGLPVYSIPLKYLILCGLDFLKKESESYCV